MHLKQTDKPDDEIRATLSVDEVSAKLGIGRDAIYSAVKRNEIPHIRIGKRIVFSRAMIARMLEGAA